MTPSTAHAVFLILVSAGKKLGTCATFITACALAQGCGGRGSQASARFTGRSGGSQEAQAEAAEHGHSGPLRILVDAQPVGDGDLWGARLARLSADPVLPCEDGGPAVATVDNQSPEHLYLRPREGVLAKDLGAIVDAARKRHGAGLDDIDSVEVGGATVRLYLRRPSPRLPQTLCEVTMPGTGPFKVTQTRPLTLSRVRGDGVPSIVVDVETDAARALGRLRHGEADLLGRLPESYWPEQTEGPATRRGFVPVRTAPERLSYLVWNLRREPVSELDVRMALSEVIDRDKLARELHRGLAEPAQPGLPLDLADAAARLDRAGWVGKGAVRQREGKLLRVVVLAAKDGHAKRFVAAWKEALRKLDVELDVSNAEGAGFASRLREGSFDVALVERPTPPGRDLSPVFGAHGSENFGGFHSAAMDAALAAHDEAAVWQAALAEAAVTPLFRRGEVALVSRALEGVRPAGGWLDLSAARWRP